MVYKPFILFLLLLLLYGFWNAGYDNPVFSSEETRRRRPWMQLWAARQDLGEDCLICFPSYFAASFLSPAL